MKKLILAMCGVLIMGTSAFSAQWVGSVIAPGEGLPDLVVNNVTEFDWSSAGSGMAVGLADPSNIFVGNTFDFLYQSRLAGMLDPSGNTISVPTLNNGWEMTLVAKINERIIGFDPVTLVANFEVATPSSWYIYFDNNSNSNTLAGTGFDDGLLAASGHWIVGDQSSFDAAVPGGAGIGNFALRGLVDSISSTYFDPTLLPNGDPFIIDIEFFGTLQRPVGNSNTTVFFSGGSATAYPTTPVTADDLLFKTDANSTFSTVPEPSTLILLGAGLLGLAGFSRRKTQK